MADFTLIPTLYVSKFPPLYSFELKWNISGSTKLAKYTNEQLDKDIVYIRLQYTSGELKLILWYTLISKDPDALKLATPDELKALKGLAHKSFCFILSYIKQLGLTPYIITLDAEPRVGKSIYSDPYKLIEYYEKIGFTLETSQSNAIKLLSLGKEVPMSASLEKVTRACSAMASGNIIDVRIIDETEHTERTDSPVESLE